MKATADSLQFCELTSFAEHEQLQEDIAAQTNKKFQFDLFKTFSDIKPEKWMTSKLLSLMNLILKQENIPVVVTIDLHDIRHDFASF